MLTFNDYCKKIFGEKLYKISLDAGMTCPNRDGTKGTRGCIFCSEGGSGDFAERIPFNSTAPGCSQAFSTAALSDAIDRAKARVSGKYHGTRYIAYFQAYTNTYAPVERLRSIFLPVIQRDDIAALSIATRPDCLPDDVLALLNELNTIKPVLVELGLQTIHDRTTAYIRRGYPLADYDRAVANLNACGIHVITHVILGLPGETKEDMLATVKHVVDVKSGGIKLQLLHVLKGTDLAKEYENGAFLTLSEDDYFDILEDCCRLLPEDMVVHRLTGDGPKALLIAPSWSADKKHVLNRVNRMLDQKLTK